MTSPSSGTLPSRCWRFSDSHLLRIGRSLAYRLANRYEGTEGREGIPVIRFGTACLRIPRWALLELIRTGRVVKLDERPDTDRP